MRRIPATIVTGFLGAGKTSLLRHLVAHAGDRRLALLINEFGDLGVDRAILQGCGDPGCDAARVVELANGCICCTVADDFLPAMQRLLAEVPPPDHVVIETSGLALPKPLIQAFAWPDVRQRLTVDGVVAVCDGPAIAAGRFAADPAAVQTLRAADDALDHETPLEELFEEQLAAADLVVVNKADDLAPHERVAVEALIRREIRPAVQLVWTQHARLDPKVALGLGIGAEDDLDSRRSHHDGGAPHDHDDFRSFVVDVPPLADPTVLDRGLAEVIRRFDLLRVKGFVVVAGRPMRHVVQAVGERIERYYDQPWPDAAPPRGRLVVIGQTAGLDEAAVRGSLAEALR